MELWAGFECTANRVGGAFHDQLRRTGHADHPEDLDRMAALGIRTVRDPMLWERTAPDAPEVCDWRWYEDARRDGSEAGSRRSAPRVGWPRVERPPPQASATDARPRPVRP